MNTSIPSTSVIAFFPGSDNFPDIFFGDGNSSSSLFNSNLDDLKSFEPFGKDDLNSMEKNILVRTRS